MKIDPGSVQDKEEGRETTAIRQAGHFTSEDVHQALFEEVPEPRTLEELKDGVGRYVKALQVRRTLPARLDLTELGPPPDVPREMTISEALAEQRRDE